MSDMQTIGLIYDIVGILILGLPLATQATKTIKNRSSTYWDMNKHEASRMLGERMDMGLGTLVLVVGFLMQIVAAQRYTLVSSMWGWSLIAALMVGLSAYYGWIRRALVERQEQNIRKQIESDD